MARASLPRLEPGVRAAFDEERCRMLLYEIGRDIVPRNPFAYGIQEIYAILLHEYGRSEIADAVSVLHELLEDESYEGYIWRSWRHGWRHRNDDILDPFVPAVDGFVLPPPTSKCIRALRAANFSSIEGDPSLPDRRSVLTHDESRPSYVSCRSLSESVGRDHSVSIGAIVKHDPPQEVGYQEDKLDTVRSQQDGVKASGTGIVQKALLSGKKADGLLRKSSLTAGDGKQWDAEFEQSHVAAQATCIIQDDESDEDSQQEFADVTGSTDHVDDSNILRFEMMAVDRRHSFQHQRIRSDPTGIVSLRPVCSGDPALELVSDVGTSSRRSSIVPLNRDIEESQEGFNDTFDRLESHLQQCQNKATASLHILETPFSASVCDSGLAVGKATGGSDHHTATSWYHDSIYNEDGEAEEFLPDRAYVDETLRMSLSAVKFHTVEKTASSIRTVSDHASLDSWRAGESKAPRLNHHESSIARQEVHSLAPFEPPSPTPGRFPIDSPGEEEISQIRSHNCKPSDHEKGVTCSPVSFERYPIDGHDDGSFESCPTCVITRRSETQPNRLIQRGRSLLQHMAQIFRKDRQSKQANQQSGTTPETYLSISQGLFRRESNKAGWCSAPRGDSPPDFAPKRTTPAYTVDGVCDEEDTLTVMSSVDLNKALPPQPHLLEHEPTVTGRISAPSPTHSYSIKPRPSTASTGSSDLSRVSSKKLFHRTAHGLIHPEMSESREPSPLRQMDSDKFLVGSKYDPLAFDEFPNTPISFSSFNNANPFIDRCNEFIPPLPSNAIPKACPDPLKVSRDHGISKSRSEGQICSPKLTEVQHDLLCHHLAQSDGTDEHLKTHSRGRLLNRDVPGDNMPQAAETPASVDQKAVVYQPESRKRSRSPVKRFLGMGKSQSLKEIPQEKGTRHDDDKKVSLKLWGDRLRHGFLTNTDARANFNAGGTQIEASKAQTPTKSTFPVSIPSLRQARLFCELELMISVAANKFLKTQQKRGLMSADSVSKICDQWYRKNRPQVLEFQFDQATQRDLILYNINTFRFHGEAGANPMVLNATMYAWKVMAKEMSVRTFCMPDSVIRKHLHDTHKVLEMLGAELTTFLVLQEMQVDALKEMATAQKKRVERRNQRAADGTSASGSTKTRKFTPPTPTSFVSTPMSAYVDEQTLFEDPCEG